MAFGGFNRDPADSTLVEINTTPLVDVMLVLLIIFIVAAPLMHNSIPIKLPKVAAAVESQKTPIVTISLLDDGDVYWDRERTTPIALSERLSELARNNPDVEIRLRADANIRYQQLAKIMAVVRASGVRRISFVTDPAPK